MAMLPVSGLLRRMGLIDLRASASCRSEFESVESDSRGGAMPETGSTGAVHSLRRDMGIWTAVSIVVGTVIGSGIFIVRRPWSWRWARHFGVLAVWVFGGPVDPRRRADLCGTRSHDA